MAYASPGFAGGPDSAARFTAAARGGMMHTEGPHAVCAARGGARRPAGKGRSKMYPLLSFGVLALGAALFVVAQKFVKDNVVFRNCVRAAGVLLAAVGVWALAMLLSGRAQLPRG